MYLAVHTLVRVLVEARVVKGKIQYVCMSHANFVIVSSACFLLGCRFLGLRTGLDMDMGLGFMTG